MSYSIEIQVCSLMFLALFFTVYLYKNRRWSFENQIYLRLFLGVLFLAADEMVCCVMLSRLLVNRAMVMPFAKAYIVIMYYCIFSVVMYAVAITMPEGLEGATKRQRLIFLSGMPLATLFGIISLFMPLDIVRIGGRFVIVGSAQIFCSLIDGLVIPFIVLYLFSFTPRVPFIKQLPMYIFAVTESVSAIVNISNPEKRVYSVSFTFLLALIYFTLENPDLKLLEALEKARYEADKANKAKSDFLANMSHEIRTPINGVLGMNEMILRGATPEETIEYAKNIKAAGNTLLSLINDILDFSKIESGKMELIPVSYDLSELITQVAILGRARAEKTNLEFKVSVEKTLPVHLYGDEVRIKQIITNLLTNAIKYTREGSVELNVSGRLVDDEFVELTVSVRDTGIGIKEDDIGKLFNAFERADEKKNRNIEGTGLGLSITCSLLGMMGSTLLVESEYGVGSNFYFRLRQRVRDKEEIGELEDRIVINQNKVAKETKTFIAPQATVLVVDDNAVNLKVVTSLLKRTKMQVTAVSSGRDALQKMTEQKFDIVFLDHMMPEMDGIETLAKSKIMENNLCKDVPIIALTANAISGAKEMYLEKGFTDYVDKPINPIILDEKLIKYLPYDKVTVIRKDA